MQKNNQKIVIDYRNARYQGCVSSQGLRNQLGILIDDDLSFYVSEWHNNKLHGNTLVYIEHGKYIYGTWYQNQPHGLNVFRSGDTVLIGFFEQGNIEGKIIVIFQKQNLIALLAKSRNSQNFSVLNCGKLLNHQELLKYIDLLEIKMPQNYFSLIKYVESFVNSQQSINSQQDENNNVIVQPCKHNHCYFGYKDGLGIVFNSNNGVVSVGNHEKMQLTGYGGKFKGRKVEEGNFQLGQTVCYNKQRPTSQIYSIFHKMHKRSLTFKNEYFDSKVKTLKSIQNVLRQNLDKIVNFSLKNKGESLNVLDLNDSLDYQNFQCIQQLANPVQEESIQIKSNLNPNGNNITKKKENISEARQNMYMNQVFQDIQTKVKIRADTSHFKQTIKKQNTLCRSPMKKQQNPVTQSKTRNVYRAKKSPLPLHKQKQISCKKQKSAFKKQNQQKFKSPLKNKNLSINTQQLVNEDDKFSKSSVKRHTNQCYRMPRYSQATLPNLPNQFQNENISKSNIKQRIFQNKNIPKFNGLLQNQNHAHQDHSFGKIDQFTDHENSLQVYRKELSKSRSIGKQKGQSISKILKRPNYMDIQQRRKKIVDQFKGLNKPQNQNSIYRKQKQTLQQKQNINNTTKPYDSPFNRQHIISSDLSQNQNGSSQCSLGLIPLSLMKKGDKVLKQSTNGNIFNRIQIDNNKIVSVSQRQKNNFRRQNPQNKVQACMNRRKSKQVYEQIKEKKYDIESNFKEQYKRQKSQNILQSSSNISQISSRQGRKLYKYYFD